MRTFRSASTSAFFVTSTASTTRFTSCSASDSAFETVRGGISAARARRSVLLGAKEQGIRAPSNPKLKWGAAAESWLSGLESTTLRPSTVACYRNAVCRHLDPRWSNRRLDRIQPSDVADLIGAMRATHSESSISIVVKVTTAVYKHAKLQHGWQGEVPTSLLTNGQRPKPSKAARRRIYTGDELAQTLAAARGVHKTLFALYAISGARLSEVLALQWSEVDLEDVSVASISINEQIDRRGRRQPLKRDDSERVVAIPEDIARLLVAHKLATDHDTSPEGFVFSTRSGRPLQQRNVQRALREAQHRAVDDHGRPTFPILHEPGPVLGGSVPSMHSFRHQAVSDGYAAGQTIEELSWQLGHKSPVVTNAVYLQETKSARRSAEQRQRLAARSGPLVSAMSAADRNTAQPTPPSEVGEVRFLTTSAAQRSSSQ